MRLVLSTAVVLAVLSGCGSPAPDPETAPMPSVSTSPSVSPTPSAKRIPVPEPTAQEATPTPGATETVKMFMLRGAAPSLEDASDATVAALAQGVCDVFAENPGADVGEFVAGMASAGVPIGEASDFVAASFVLVCPELTPAELG